jgi:hypothetical protein
MGVRRNPCRDLAGMLCQARSLWAGCLGHTVHPMAGPAHAALLVASVLAISGCAGARSGAPSTGRFGPAGADKSLRVGQTRKFAHLRADQILVCVGKGDAIRLKLRREAPGANSYRFAWDKKLSLTLVSSDGGMVARCEAR